MRVNGEFLFDSFQDALNFVSQPTNYEKDNGFYITSSRIIELGDDMKIVLRETSDKQISMFIFYKNSKRYDIWKFWMPSENQINYFITIFEVYQNLDKYNKSIGGN